MNYKLWTYIGILKWYTIKYSTTKILGPVYNLKWSLEQN